MEMSFGARLRQQREERHVALEEISAKTKIKVSLLEGLEGDDLSRWPQGIFRRAYIRSYAQAIGLEPDVVVQQFLALYPDPVEEVPLVAPESPKRPPTRLRFLLSAAFGSAAARHAPDEIREGSRERLDQVNRADSAERTTAVDQLATADRTGLVARTGVHETPERVPPAPQPVTPAFADLAGLCTRIGRASKLGELEAPLADAMRMLNAAGSVLWAWEPRKAALRPRVSCGYAEDVLARFPLVGRDADNAIGAAFRSGRVAVVEGTDGETGAIAVPLLGPEGCVGVLALEVHHGQERNDTMHAIASIVAAQFVSFCTPPALADAVNA